MQVRVCAVTVVTLFASLSGFILSKAKAQDVIVKWTRVVNGTPLPEETVPIGPAPTSGQPFTINLPFEIGPGGYYDTPVEYVGAIRIYTTSSNIDLGHITLQGNMAWDFPLQVLIADENHSWQSNGELEITPSFRHWAGITSVNILPDSIAPSLDDRIEVAAAVYGNMQGSTNDRIKVGRVRRLQCTNNSNITGFGKMLLPVQASRHPLIADSDPFAIFNITAADQIGGAIHASDSTSTQPQFATGISRIVVGPSDAATGITGRIYADGVINNIISTGPITVPSPVGEPAIFATGAIERIYAGNATSSGFPSTARSISASIQSGILSSGGLGAVPMRSLRTNGDLLQPVTVDSITNIGASASGNGIWVGGTVYAPITIRRELVRSYISANTFASETINIGMHLNGYIEARASNGHLPTINIGFEPLDGAELAGDGWRGNFDPVSQIDWRSGPLQPDEVG